MDTSAHAGESSERALGEDPETASWFGVPQLPPRYASRSRLLSSLSRSRGYPLVLVSAPAGTGKTSLVADWVRSLEQPDRTAWVTVEADEEACWPALAGCLERLGVAVSGRAFSGDTVDRRALLSLTAAVAHLPRRVTVVMDGYEMTSAEVAADVDFLLRHSGHRLRLVIVTRVDPVLPLYRYRLADSMTEVRMSDLAFTDDEASGLLKSCGVELTRDSVHALNRRTQGWAVGLRFAARILAQRPDPDAAVAEITGDTGNIAEYLLGEVLESQTPEVRRLLLSTSVPDTLPPGLVQALGGRSALRTLSLLTRGNAFIEPVPQHAGSHRYHPLFRDLLRAQLAYESPELMETLQRTTAAWFARQGRTADSVRHLVAIDAWADAAAAVVDDLAVGQLLLHGRSDPLTRSIEAIPEDVTEPAACVVRATLALTSGDLDRFDEQLERADEGSERSAGAHDRAVALAIAVLKVVHARHVDDASATLILAEQAEHLLESGDDSPALARHPELYALVLTAKGAAEAREGRLKQAYDTLSSGADVAAAPGAESLLFECLGQMAVLACFSGRVALASALATRANEVAEQSGLSVADRPAAAAAALAWVCAERVDQRHGLLQVEAAERSDPTLPDPVARTLLTVAKSRLETARGHLPRALVEIDEASAALPERQGWMTDKLLIEKCHLRVANGEPQVALRELAELETPSDPEATLVAAQAHLQQGDDDAAAASLAPVLAKDAPPDAQTEGWLVEAARQLHRGSSARARTALKRALRLAAGEKLRRPFTEAPTGVRYLITNDPELRSESAWLVDDAPRTSQDHLRRAVPREERVAAPADQFLVVENLTAKELEVLGHLAELLTTEEIASAMFVSVNTIRTHVRSILRKLGVSRRNAAVRRARDLELLPS
jgi:LuxR family transcriptional regulator, maltose regulon positive regulatory protein